MEESWNRNPEFVLMEDNTYLELTFGYLARKEMAAFALESSVAVN